MIEQDIKTNALLDVSQGIRGSGLELVCCVCECLLLGRLKRGICASLYSVLCAVIGNDVHAWGFFHDIPIYPEIVYYEGFHCVLRFGELHIRIVSQK